MIFQDFHEKEETVDAINRFLEKKELDAEESKQGIEDSLVRIVHYDFNDIKIVNKKRLPMRYTSVGLLMTTNGIFITNNHVAYRMFLNWKKTVKQNPIPRNNKIAWLKQLGKFYHVIDKDGVAYPINITFYGPMPGLDLAILKAMIPNNPEPMHYKTRNIDLLEDDPVEIIGFKKEKPYRVKGKVLIPTVSFLTKVPGKSSDLYDSFKISAYAAPSVSGSPIVSGDGELAGIVSTCMFKTGMPMEGPACCAKSKHIRNLLQYVKDNYLDKR